jgi:hypothetical protein
MKEVFIYLNSLKNLKKNLMKKIAFLLIAGGIFISSCKKNYTCTCVDSTAAGGATRVSIIPGATQAEAAAICEAGNAYTQGTTQQTTCTL